MIKQVNKQYDRELLIALAQAERALLYVKNILESREEEPDVATNEPNYEALEGVVNITYANMCTMRPYANSIINVSLLQDFRVEEVS